MPLPRFPEEPRKLSVRSFLLPFQLEPALLGFELGEARKSKIKYAPVAQEVEHLPFKQGVRGSSPRWSTNEAVTPPGVAASFFFRWLEPRTPKRAAFFERSGSSKPPEGLFIKNIPLNIDFSRGLAYNGVAERQCIEDVHYLHRRTNPLGEPPPRGFFRFYGPDGLPAGFAALLSIKPFANVICHNTCQDGEEKHFEDVHRPFTSLTARCRQRSDYNIWFFVFQCKERPKYK